MNKFNLLLLLSVIILFGCSTVSVKLESTPPGASIYRGISENGPWERVKGSDSVTPMSVEFSEENFYIKAKKYGYDDSEVININKIKEEKAHLFQLNKLFERKYDSFYEASVTKIILENKKNIAVMNFSKKGDIEVERAYYVSEFIQDLLLKTGAFNIVDRKNIENTLKEIGFQMSGLTTNDKIAKVGKMLNVQEMVFGSIGHLDSNYIITLNMIDVETGKVIYTGNRTFQKDNEMGKLLVEMINELVDKRFGK